ncbi:UDP-N-acetylmuramate dehydrogenase [Estrella lausannensis]|uniref:UDP-N-acetylenolpyruvoylglucosamine reductase n=1 Tax=Estrella lausannensis TaxID=483423 RepID=A0A0H5DPU3_9BACT|nr:UDP-N-acetylmuramate dehydrogenase [Estrella lausannensis]CRX38048.1 UDP-N-acetylenolpyruvoylglucosamine reductase [Estrella lausannensis]
MIKIEENVSLSAYSTMGLGGPAKFFTKAESEEEMREALAFAKAHNVPFLVIGKGSNCLFHDKGYKGLVILNKIDFFHDLGEGVFHVGGGTSFSLLGVKTARLHYAGLEFASGIPATVGGAVYMNAGASGKETKDTLESVDYMDPDGNVRRYRRDELSFSYRKSMFQKMKGVILSATFSLTPNLEARSKQIAIVQHRTKTQPYGEKSCGCAFRNPEGNFAGALIEKCGLKGARVGGAEVSHLHANFLINKSDAKADDIRSLIELIKKTVKEKESIDLEVEVCFISSGEEDA